GRADRQRGIGGAGRQRLDLLDHPRLHVRVTMTDVDVVDLALEIPHPTLAGDLEAGPLGADDLERPGPLLGRPGEHHVLALTVDQAGHGTVSGLWNRVVCTRSSARRRQWARPASSSTASRVCARAAGSANAACSTASKNSSTSAAVAGRRWT